MLVPLGEAGFKAPAPQVRSSLNLYTAVVQRWRITLGVGLRENSVVSCFVIVADWR
ncbi:penicillin-binding protein 1C [Acetobacter orientalis]|uniref:Penicillin-binding protein 1C n=1 Tax=Acetobacter orientalis TaxID=146474 RepID=A0A2Z5ZGK9_9PROT|nr:penicillin-binding protein 1C [Acetobacter orientalis]